MATAKIVFATITGNNEDIADIIAQALEEKGLSVSVEEISQADPADFEDVDLCVVCPYTYDEGSLPDEGLDFYEEFTIHLSDEEQEKFFDDNPDFMSKFPVERDKMYLLMDWRFRRILRKIGKCEGGKG